jgi:hypothetical protein
MGGLLIERTGDGACLVDAKRGKFGVSIISAEHFVLSVALRQI